MNISKFNEFIIVNDAWQKIDMPGIIFLPKHHSLFHLGTIVRNNKEYVLLLLQGPNKSHCFLNEIDMNKREIFHEITDDNEYHDLLEFVKQSKLNAVFEGRSLGKNGLV